MSDLHNVHDMRRQWIGGWKTEPLDFSQLWAGDEGRTVIYSDQHRREAGTLISWGKGIVFARYSTGETASGAHASNLVFGIDPLDGPALPANSPRNQCGGPANG